MSHLSDLYQRKVGFPQYRSEQLRNITDTPESEALKTLKAKRARLIAEVDAEIAQVRYKLATQQGSVLSKTARKAKRKEELTQEKREIDSAFAAEVKDRINAGTSVATLAKECGASSHAIFYQAQTYANETTVELNTAHKAYKPEQDTWHYSDITKFHRYAVNVDRTIFRIHDTADPDNVAYIRRIDEEVLRGDTTLKGNFDSSRAEELISALDDPDFDATNTRSRPNPYRGI